MIIVKTPNAMLSPNGKAALFAESTSLLRCWVVGLLVLVIVFSVLTAVIIQIQLLPIFAPDAVNLHLAEEISQKVYSKELIRFWILDFGLTKG